VRSYLTITQDLSRVMTRVKAIYRSWAIPPEPQIEVWLPFFATALLVASETESVATTAT
jgi:hypothetical protein